MQQSYDITRMPLRGSYGGTYFGDTQQLVDQFQQGVALPDDDLHILVAGLVAACCHLTFGQAEDDS